MYNYNFYDTSSLLELNEKDFEKIQGSVVISSVTLTELEKIKTSNNKDEKLKFAARRFLSYLSNNPNFCEVIVFNTHMLKPIDKYNLIVNDDSKILATAIYFQHMRDRELIFYTNDLSLYHIAKLFFDPLHIKKLKVEIEDYDGYLEMKLNHDQLADFYSNPTINTFNLNINEYLIIRDKDNNVLDTLCWTGKDYRHLNYKNFNSKQFGDVKPLKGDIYQALFADSLINNKITMVKGPAGSGKTFLSLAYLFNQLEYGRIDKIVIFCNTIATKNSAKLGFYPGTRDEKLLDSQIGNLLISKLGGRIIVEQLIQEEKLILLPLSDIRGYDTSGMNAGIYISEAQNMDVELMKLTLQRIGEDSICIIDGDCKAQVDNEEFAGARNGMRRASEVFRGHDVYGEITLKNIHRSKIARIAENL